VFNNEHYYLKYAGRGNIMISIWCPHW